MTPGRCPNQPSPRWQRILLTAFREPGRHFFCELHLHPQLSDRGLVIPDSASGASGFFPDSAASRATFTHLPRVISWTPMLRATSATGRPPSMTKATDCSLYSGVNARRVEPISRSPGKSGQLSRVSTEAGTVQFGWIEDVVRAGVRARPCP